MNIQSVQDIFEEQLESRIVTSNLQACNIDSLTSIVQNWKREGYKIVFTAGVFDIFTINHLLALYHYKLLGGSRTKLIVSIDTDKRVGGSKSFQVDKGNSVKPILSWYSRALMVAMQAFRNQESLVDLIVQHGQDTCTGVRCPHDDNTTIAEKIVPDFIVVTSTSEDTIAKIKASHMLDSKTMVVINERDLAYSDPLLDDKISTSAIIKRIKYGA